MSTWFSAWIFPLAVTLATMSCSRTGAEVTGTTPLSREETNHQAPRATTTPPPAMSVTFIFFVIDRPSNRLR